MNWQEFTALLVLATAMSFTPGPNTTLSTALAANHGLRRAMPFVCAVPVGWSALLVVCTLGLGALVLAVPLLSWSIKLAGVAYLLWLAFKISRSRQLSQAIVESYERYSPKLSAKISSSGSPWIKFIERVNIDACDSCNSVVFISTILTC